MLLAHSPSPSLSEGALMLGKWVGGVWGGELESGVRACVCVRWHEEKWLHFWPRHKCYRARAKNLDNYYSLYILVIGGL